MKTTRIARLLAGAGLLGIGATAQAQFSDDFETYALGGGVVGQNNWELWCDPAGGAVDGTIDDAFAVSGTQSLRLDLGTDVVQPITGVDDGQWVFSIWIYAPSTSFGTGWVNLMNDYCNLPFGLSDWTTATQFSISNLTVQAWGGQSLPLVTDRWVEYRVEFDLDNDTFSEYYGGQELTSNLTWSSNVGAGGNTSLQGIDLYGDDSFGIFYDNLTLEQAGGCYADCDGNETLDVFDFLCFQEAFVAMDPYADCDGNTTFDVFDFLCFQDAFVTGCP
jgi:hypothetical protein